jgi:hypothetical protein
MSDDTNNSSVDLQTILKKSLSLVNEQKIEEALDILTSLDDSLFAEDEAAKLATIIKNLQAKLPVSTPPKAPPKPIEKIISDGSLKINLRQNTEQKIATRPSTDGLTDICKGFSKEDRELVKTLGKILIASGFDEKSTQSSHQKTQKNTSQSLGAK